MPPVNSSRRPKSPSAGKTPESLEKYLCFMLSGKCYGFNIISVKEIIEAIDITPIPRMPKFFRGAIHLRTHIVPVLDLAVHLGMAPTEDNRRTCIIITEIGVKGKHVDVGILVDAVNQVTDVPASSIEPAPSLAETIDTEFISGITRINDQFTILLNLESVFSAEVLIGLKEYADRQFTAANVNKEHCNEVSK